MHDIMKADPQVRPRIRIERQIVRQVVRDLLSAGYWLSVFDGEEVHPATRSLGKLTKTLMETDEDFLMVLLPAIDCHCGQSVTAEQALIAEYHAQFNCPHCGACLTWGYVRFVYGNDGWDVINDYTTNLESVIGDGTATDKLIQRYS